VIAFCEAAGLELCIVGLSSAETTQDMADLVEYLYGSPATHWGAQRVSDGHPAAYPAVGIEVSNEACMASFNVTFAEKAAAMEASARANGMQGKLRYVTGSYQGITSPARKCPGSPNTTLEVGALCARCCVVRDRLPLMRSVAPLAHTAHRPRYSARWPLWGCVASCMSTRTSPLE
jgi:hypothetical protein